MSRQQAGDLTVGDNTQRRARGIDLDDAPQSQGGETRQFKMHPKLLMDVIRRQAGTIGKAVLEGVMNSVDAKATECTIELNKQNLLIVDNGQGFRSREEIERWFEVFGQPHEESEEKTYGTFRMGRGQLFAFGDNLWRSGNHRMAVDVKRRGLDYDLHEEDERYEGCRIEVQFYSELNNTQLADTIKEINVLCKYAPVALKLNDKVVNKDPESEKWDFITDDAYIKIRKTTSLSVYHLGMYIKEYNSYKFGVGGVILAKKQLKLNFARNDVLVNECRVWKRVAKHFTEKAETHVREKGLDDGGREMLARRLSSEEMEDLNATQRTEMFDRKIITAVTGRHFSLRELHRNATYRYQARFSVAPKGSRVGDIVMKAHTAFVFATETLDRFNCESVVELLELFSQRWRDANATCRYNAAWVSNPTYVPLEELSEGMNTSFHVLEARQLKPNERVWQEVIEHGAWYLARRVRDIEIGTSPESYRPRVISRAIQIGDSELADGWTDGMHYIAVSRQYLKKLNFKAVDVFKLGHLLLHEYCHNDVDTGDHDHDQAFYEKYHDCSDAAAVFATKAMLRLPRSFEHLERQITRKVTRAVDALGELEQGSRRFETQLQRAREQLNGAARSEDC